MKEVKLGAIYLMKVSGRPARVRVNAVSPYGWEGRNLDTNRPVRIRSAARLRELSDSENTKAVLAAAGIAE
jgi:hypothetical protein